MKFDVCVEFDHSVIPHAIIRLRIIKPKKVISVLKKGRYGLQGKQLEIYDYYTEKPKNSHFRDIWLNTLNPFNVKPESKKYDFFCTDQQKKKAINFLLQFQNKITIGVNLEGAVKGKRITPDKLKAICRGLYQANKDVQIILLSSPKTYKDVIRLSKNMELPYVFSSYKTESIIDVAALIQNLQLIITPDTSIVHIASAFNVPIVSIHENNNDSYQLFAPKSQYSKTVFAQSVKGIDEYSINELTRYSDELISRVN
jgi:ADP-heptose:LPS heptosyltransferase